MSIGGLIGLGVLAFVVLLLANRRSRAALGAQVNKLWRAVWGFDPVAVYQAQVDSSAEEIKDATKGLEQYQGLVARLQRQVESGTKEKNRLEALIKSALNAGQEQRATDYAMQLKRTENDLAENAAQLAQYEGAYKANLKKIQHAHSKIEEAKRRAQQLKADLKLSAAEAETAKLAQNFNVKTNNLDGLGEIEEEINRQIDLNRGKARVAADLSSEGLADIEADEAIKRQEAEDVLARFRQPK